MFEHSFLTSSDFSYPEKRLPDGSVRKAGRIFKLFVQETGPTPKTSPVYEVQVESEFFPVVEQKLNSLKKGDLIKYHGEALGKRPTDQIGRIKLLGF